VQLAYSVYNLAIEPVLECAPQGPGRDQQHRSKSMAGKARTWVTLTDAHRRLSASSSLQRLAGEAPGWSEVLLRRQSCEYVCPVPSGAWSSGPRCRAYVLERWVAMCLSTSCGERAPCISLPLFCLCLCLSLS